MRRDLEPGSSTVIDVAATWMVGAPGPIGDRYHSNANQPSNALKTTTAKTRTCSALRRALTSLFRSQRSHLFA